MVSGIIFELFLARAGSKFTKLLAKLCKGELQTTEAELCIDMGKYDIGVIKTETGNYELVSDWWGVETTKGLSEQEIVKEINQKYAYQRVVAAVEEAGYTVENNNVAADGTVKLSVSKWE